jgi:murein L,D-transpeptidase YcbB/YkuD
MRLMRHDKWLAAGLLLLAAGGCGERTVPSPGPQPATPAFVAEKVVVPPEIADFYRERGNRPLWVSGKAVGSEGLELARRIEAAADHGLDPERYGAAGLKAALAAGRGGDPRALAHAELLLTRAYPDFVRDLRVPAAAAGMKYIDQGLAPDPPSPRALLDAAAAGRPVAEAARMNPLYEALRRGHARWRAAHPEPAAAEAALIRANLDRARAVPGLPGRYLIVDAASARLWMVDGGRVDGPMRVIVGKPGMETPAMAGLMRYVVLNPYWNLPPDLARDRARRVLREGTGFLRRERLQILSDWSDRPRVLRPSQVDWRAVASGRRTLRMRQLPGGANVMGAVKFMMPNHLGIYLHDFPDKALFARADRRLSSGCVRLADAPRLARWLFRGAPPRPAGPAPEQEVDLPEPVPVYITYLTVLPDPKTGLTFHRDVYGRDRIRLATR